MRYLQIYDTMGSRETTYEWLFNTYSHTLYMYQLGSRTFVGFTPKVVVSYDTVSLFRYLL